MEKRIITFAENRIGQIVVNNHVVDVSLVIDPTNQAYLISQYIDELFRTKREDEDNYNPSLRRIGAETVLMINVLEQCTSIDTLSMSGDEYLSADLFDIYKATKEVIHNFADFRQLLDKTIEDKEKQIAVENSVGHVLDNAISKVIAAMTWVSNMNIDDETLDKMKDTVNYVIAEMENSKIAPVFKEAEIEAKKSKKKVGNGSSIKQ
jgi:hypothetical protein